jgi:hypothetical protein
MNLRLRNSCSGEIYLRRPFAVLVSEFFDGKLMKQYGLLKQRSLRNMLIMNKNNLVEIVQEVQTSGNG